ncbi:MAG: ABC transporter permease [Hyphomicrobiales bacterium]|jgi:ribose transport system permease protein|nr:MAG: ABC transporter permease [Hyphomicrobiales bacterium]
MTEMQEKLTVADAGPVAPEARSRGSILVRLGVGRYFGLYLLIMLVVFFCVADPRFATADNFRALAASQAIAGILTLGLMISLISGVFDISIAANMSLAISLVGYLQANRGVDPVLAVLITLGLGMLIGAVNAFVITVLHVEAIVATLGMSAILAAVSFWIVKGQTVLYGISPGFKEFGQAKPLSVPIPVFYFLGIAIVLWMVLEHTTWGRYLRAAGQNPEATRLAGVKVIRLQWSALLLAGLLASLAGVVLTMQLGASSFGAGEPYLLPAFAAVFLGATQIQPGRFNVIGTVVALYLLAVAVKGLQLRNPSLPWIADLIQGLTLIVSVALATYVIRRRSAAGT